MFTGLLQSVGLACDEQDQGNGSHVDWNEDQLGMALVLSARGTYTLGSAASLAPHGIFLD